MTEFGKRDDYRGDAVVLFLFCRKWKNRFVLSEKYDRMIQGQKVMRFMLA